MENIEIKCLEKILEKITSLIMLYEFEDDKKVIHLCDEALTISAQLDFLRNHINTENEE